MKKSLNVFLIILLVFSSAPNLTLAEEKEKLLKEYKLYSTCETRNREWNI